MATLFWVGGTGTYDGTTNHFATTTGGTATVAAVTAADTVTFDANSGTAATVSTTAALSCLSLTMNKADLTLSLGNTLTCAVTGTMTLTTGTFNTNGQTCSFGFFNASGAATRSLSLGASSITLTGGGGTHWNLASTGLTFSAGTSNITLSYTSTCTFNGGNLSYNNVTFNFLMGIGLTVSGSNNFVNLTFTGTTGTSSNQTAPVFSGNQTITGTFTATSFSTAARMVIASNVINTPRTFTAAAVSLTNVDFRDIAGAGVAAPFTGTGLGDCGGNSGITFPASVTRYAVVAGNWTTTATWAATSGGAAGASIPLPQDDVVLDANSGIGTITKNMVNSGRNITCTGYTGGLLISQSGTSIYGSLTLNSTMTFTMTANALFFRSRTAATIASFGKSFGASVTFEAPGGTYSLQDDLTMPTSATLGLNYGTIDANGKNVTVGTFSSNNANTRAVTMGSGTWTITGTGGTIWNISNGTNMTMNTGTATLVMNVSAAGTRTLSSAVNYPATQISGSDTVVSSGLGVNAPSFDFTGFTGQWQAAGSTIGNLTLYPGMTMSYSNTVTITGAFNATGSLGNLITIKSTTAGTQKTLSKASGVVSADYLSLQDSATTGGATWYAGANSTNVSNNTGWIFTAAPIASSNLLLMGVG